MRKSARDMFPMSFIPAVRSFNELVIPYAMSDINSGIATVEYLLQFLGGR
jgi:hypothetical protein